MPLYLRKVEPDPIKAVQFTGDNFQELWKEFGEVGIIRSSFNELIVRTVQGQKVAVGVGEWVVADATEGTFYPIDNEVFHRKFYEWNEE